MQIHYWNDFVHDATVYMVNIGGIECKAYIQNELLWKLEENEVKDLVIKHLLQAFTKAAEEKLYASFNAALAAEKAAKLVKPKPKPWTPPQPLYDKKSLGDTVLQKLFKAFPGIKGWKGFCPAKEIEVSSGLIACDHSKVWVDEGAEKAVEDGKVPKNLDGFPLTMLIMHLNDQHEWTREAIADWLETLDCDITLQISPEKTGPLAETGGEK